jgi:hypothetical protein
MKAIGGFFGLELGAPHAPLHGDALGLCSGRACLKRILGELRPTKAHVPFFICDSALRPFDALDVPRTFYPLSPTLEPMLPDTLAAGSCVLIVNYFGLMGDAAARAVARGDARVVVDDTQAFFTQGHEAAWSFNSARKFFGVPDGGYAYGDGVTHDERHPPSTEIRYEHLINRLLGRQDLAYQQYQDSEAHICEDVRAISELSRHVLAGIDYARARARRLENFALAHRLLGSLNRLALPLRPGDGDVPFCYPLLPDRGIDRKRLWAQGLFVPTLWPEVGSRAAEGFLFERGFSERLLPLPIDQRYGPEEIEWMCRLVNEVL